MWLSKLPTVVGTLPVPENNEHYLIPQTESPITPTANVFIAIIPIGLA
jgi:hypothetical protein